MTINEQLNQQRNTPGFASKTAEEQYNAQKSLILSGLMGNSNFTALPREEQLAAFKNSLKKGVSYVYENPEMGQMVSQTVQRILAGDQETAKVASNYSLGSYTHEKMPMVFRLASRIGTLGQNNVGYNGLWGVPDEYFNSGFNTSKTRGADDNKAREEINNALEATNPEAYAETSKLAKTAKIFGIIGMVGEGIAMGQPFSQSAAMMTGGGQAAAKMGAKEMIATAGKRFVKKAPELFVEASIEGFYGIAEGVADAAQKGGTLRGWQIPAQFAMYAGGDLAFNSLISTVAPLLKYTISPYLKSVKKATRTGRFRTGRHTNSDVIDWAKELKNGEMPVEFEYLLDNPAIFDHMETTKRYWDIQEGLKTHQDLESLTELDRTINDAYELGFDVIPKTEGGVRVRLQGDLEKAFDYDDIYKAREAMGAEFKLDTLLKMDLQDHVKFASDHSTILNYGFIGENLDGHATAYGGRPEGAKKFIDVGTRQRITPGEADDLATGFTPGEIARFDSPITEAELLSKKNIFEGGETLTLDPKTANTSGNTLVHLHSSASAKDWDKAIKYAEDIIAREGLNVAPELVARDLLITRGFDSARPADGSIKVFFPDRIKVVTDYVDPATGKLGQSAFNKAAKKAPLSTINLKGEGDVSARARKVGQSPVGLGRLATRALSGELTEDGVEALSRAYAGRLGGSGLRSKIKVFLDSNTRVTSFKVAKVGDSILINGPSNITNQTQARQAYADLTRDLDKIFPVKGGKTRKSYLSAFDNASKRFMLPMANPEMRESWIKGLAELNGSPLAKVNGWFNAKLKDGTVIKTRSSDEVARALIIDYTDPELIRYDALAQGFNIKKTGDDLYEVYTSGNNKIAEGTFNGVLDDIGYNPSKVPSSLAPQLTVINKVPGVKMKVTINEFNGSKIEADQYMSMFEDYNTLLRNAGADVKKSGEAMIKHSNIKYEVRVPQINYTTHFDNAVDAKKFFNGGWKKLEGLRNAAIDKGLRLNYDNGYWTLKSPEGSFMARSIDELHTQLQGIATPTYVKNFVPDDLNTYLKSIGKQAELIPMNAMGAMDSVDAYPKFEVGDTDTHMRRVRNYFRPAMKVIRNEFNRIGDVKGGQLFEKLVDSLDIWKARARPTDNAILDIFSDSAGRRITAKRREGISAILEAKTDDAARKVMDDPLFEMEADDWDRAVQARKVWDMMGDIGNFDNKKLLQNYVSHVRNRVNTDSALSMDDQLSKDYLKKIFKNVQTSPRELQLFYGIERTGDMTRLIRNNDAMDLMLTYNKIINRDLFVTKAWRDVYDHLASGKEKFSPMLMEQINTFRERITSPQLTEDQKSINDGVKRLLKKFGFQVQEGERYVDWFSKWNYRTAMAWRPWLAVRNVYQTHVILPLKTGSIRVVNRAMKQFLDDPDAAIQELHRRGITHESDGIANQLHEFHKSKGVEGAGGWAKATKVVENFYERGMEGFGRSDAITRSVAHFSALDLFAQGEKAMAKSGKLDDFLRKSRLEVFHPNIQRRVIGLLQAGHKEAAENSFSKAMINSTMFDYRPTNRPLVQKGFLGSLGMQYGTHPINALEAIAETFQYGSLSARGKGIIAATASSVALGATMKAMGINNSSFLLWKQAIFSGGPGYGLITQAPLLLSQGYKGDLARRDYNRMFMPAHWDKEQEKLAWQVPQIMPGFYQVKYWGDAMKYFENGYLWEGFLSLGTVPIDKDRRDMINEQTDGKAGG